ncbi:MAG: glycosyltransferase [Candidatus Eremiobacteraeota bacterium]|nr:glycosyltransferase [Candidatus Eremiobacteraeota bacterium]
MKRLLLVTYHFPPEPVAGAVRPGYLARYLSEFGWEVTVLTRPLGDPGFSCDLVTAGMPTAGFEARVRESFQSRGKSEHSRVRSALRHVKEMLLVPDRTVPWVPGAIRAGLDLTAKRHFDAMISTALPPSVHIVGGAIARARNIPWIADYRDPWAGNYYAGRGPVRSAIERVLERTLITRAESLTTISQPIADQLRALHRRTDVHVIPNAYDPAEWSDLSDVTPSRFSLCFTGNMYDGKKRSPELLFAALAALKTRGDAAASAQVDFYGQASEFIGACAERFGISDRVQQHGTVPRADAMRAQREAAVLLIFLATERRTLHEMGSKFLEYLGARRPIIAFGPRESVMRPYIEQHNIGWFASDLGQAQDALREAYARYSARNYQVEIDEATAPTARRLAERFAAVLDDTPVPERALVTV